MDGIDEHDAVGAFALDALSDDERAAFERHLRTCPACREEVRQLTQVVDVLPLAVEPVDPPAGLRERIVREITPTPVSLAVRRRRLAVALPLLATAAVVVLLGLWNLQLRSTVDRQTAQVAVLQAIAHHARVLPVPGSSAAPSAAAYLVQPAGNAPAYLVVSGLSKPAAGKVYQLWLVQGRVPHSAAVFTPSGTGVTIVSIRTSVAGYEVAAVTVEPGPNGSSGPTGPKVLAGKISA